jgi:hypothetical protein
MARYKQLLFYAAKLPAMPAEQHQPENKVEGCVSQVGRFAWSIAMLCCATLIGVSFKPLKLLKPLKAEGQQ